jgi:hypothetical protein
MSGEAYDRVIRFRTDSDDEGARPTTPISVHDSPPGVSTRQSPHGSPRRGDLVIPKKSWIKAWAKSHTDERCVAVGLQNKQQLLHLEELLCINGGYLLAGVSEFYARGR